MGEGKGQLAKGRGWRFYLHLWVLIKVQRSLPFLGSGARGPICGNVMSYVDQLLHVRHFSNAMKPFEQHWWCCQSTLRLQCLPAFTRCIAKDL